ncbi:MAG: zinc-ribbon domain-containing protein [Bacteroidales bacterium]
MSLIRCPKCSSQISEEAENCPKCGYPISPMAKLKWAVQSPCHKKTIVDSQSVYAWIIIVLGFIIVVIAPYESTAAIVSRASGTALILIGLIWGFIVGLERWWSH